MNHKAESKGFTLLELMIVIVIVSILGVLGYNTYSSQLIRSNRADAKTMLSRIAQQQERFYTENLKYAANLIELRGGGKNTINSENDHYSITLEDTSNTDFTIVATAISPMQLRDKQCRIFKQNRLGEKTASNPAGNDATNDCW